MRITTLRNAADRLCEALAEASGECPQHLWATAVNHPDSVPDVVFDSSTGAYRSEQAEDFWMAFQSLRAAEQTLIANTKIAYV